MFHYYFIDSETEGFLEIDYLIKSLRLETRFLEMEPQQKIQVWLPGLKGVKNG